MDRNDLITKLSLAWRRALLPYPIIDDLYAVYLDEGLTGFALIIDEPLIGEFKGKQSIMIPLSQWQVLRHLAADTVTPFRIVAVGTGVVVGAWQAHTGLKYPVRNEAISPCTVHIPVSEFIPLNA